MYVLQRSNADLDKLFNITEVLIHYMHTILAYFRDSLAYIRQIAIHMIAYDVFPVENLRNMLRHIESELLSTMHLPTSSDNTFHFYLYLSTTCTNSRQFLLVVDVPIQNRVKQLPIYQIFSLPVPHSNLSAKDKINHKYIGVTYDETKAVVISYLQFRACQHANGQFCRIKHHETPSLTHHHVLQPYMPKPTKQ